MNYCPNCGHDIRGKNAQEVVSYAGERVPSSYGYPAGYRPKPLDLQIQILRAEFPKLGSYDKAAAAKAPPAIMEGVFAIPRWETVAPTYGEAVELVIAKIAARRAVCNYREGQLGPDRLKESVRKVEMTAKLREAQKGHDILAVPAQFGLRYRGCSVRCARELFADNEFGLGAYEVGIMVLTHSERFTAYEDLFADCPGDEYAPESDAGFTAAPCWHFYDGGLGFGTCDVDDAHPVCGSASAALPE